MHHVAIIATAVLTLGLTCIKLLYCRLRLVYLYHQ